MGQGDSPRQVLRERERALAADDAAGRLALARYALEHKLSKQAAKLLIEVCAQDSEDARSEAVSLLSETLDYHLDDEGSWLSPDEWYPLRGYVKTRAGWKQPEELELDDLHKVWAGEVLKLVNEFRKENGLRALRRDAKAEKAAQGHALDMAERGFFNHVNPDGVKLGQRVQATKVKHYAAGENIARGQKSPQEVMEGWIASPGHRANLLRPYWTKLGVGLARGTNHKAEPELVWVQVFINTKKPKRKR